ncbi:MAG TPA: DUF3500 domain-containing protein [Vicinamibacterales bacterium]|nr:DUF3500 domain-containing protein [Vicinamibacterales bacterium]
MTLTHRILRSPAIVLTVLLAVAGVRAAQQAYQQRRASMSADAEKRGLAEPFKGITTAGTVVPGLFPVRSTGVSTAAAQAAAEAFLKALTPEQKARTVFDVDDDEWRKWMNQHFYLRQGVSFEEMSEAQRHSAIGLLRASLSAKGLKLSRDIMRLNHTLGELNNGNFEEYGEWLYHLTVMGTPSAKEPWGWQLDGHHLIVNYFVLGDQVVMTPLFVGSEPVTAAAGKFKGTTILQAEQAAGLAMIQTLDEGQRRKAIIAAAKEGNNNLTEAFRDNVVLDYAGLRASELSAAQRRQLTSLIQLFVDNMKEGHARVRMAEVRAHLDDTRLAWVGPTDANAVFYFRIHSPVILIEFDHQRPANLRHLARDPRQPTREHIHVVVRTPNGNDYGKDLLRQHYAQHEHR